MTQTYPIKSDNNKKTITVASGIVGRGTVVGYSFVRAGLGIEKVGTEFQVNPAAIEAIAHLATMAERLGGLSAGELRQIADALKQAKGDIS